ncbi:MAG: ThiF family adenylyltransferase [Chloroflexi bacterium]|uniref:HesA/MoeB/ThiF family protein n=1 Tax=Candidatus Flexifilum breve TaxID=3140694 RepID=UPI003136ACB5|nr:ThiF family adenylyltransferase [Chloroflexota bacterium]
MREATALVIGAGALGNEVLKNLALMGIGRFLIVDFDTIEIGNLSRSPLFRQADAGQRKAEVAARAVKELNPDVQVKALHADVNHDLGAGVFRHADVVIGCLDNREARLSINRMCYQINHPWIDGAIESLMGIARVFVPGEGACYECMLTERDFQIIEMRRSCSMLARENIAQGKVPTTPTAASIVGALQTQEALKLLHHMAVQPGTNIVVNGLTNENYQSSWRFAKAA